MKWEVRIGECGMYDKPHRNIEYKKYKNIIGGDFNGFCVLVNIEYK